MQEKTSWKKIVEESLNDLSAFLAEGRWFGRENEVVNLFAHRFLLRHLGEGPFIDPSQIGIEVAVRQIPKAKGKKLVRKDLVLWNNPLQTVWENRTAINSPAVILEWKNGKKAKCTVDIKWLQAYTKIYPRVLGYSICAVMMKNRGIWFRKIVKGKIVK